MKASSMLSERCRTFRGASSFHFPGNSEAAKRGRHRSVRVESGNKASLAMPVEVSGLSISRIVCRKCGNEWCPQVRKLAARGQRASRIEKSCFLLAPG
jgi:hypothetical protein